MKRPQCPVCGQRACAVNYYRDGVAHWRSRCDSCIRKSRQLRPRRPKWAASGFQKKNTCDRCGFRSRYSSQIVVYHVDGDLNNVDPRNLKCVCRNCEIDVAKSDLPWRPGDLVPDR